MALSQAAKTEVPRYKSYLLLLCNILLNFMSIFLDLLLFLEEPVKQLKPFYTKYKPILKIWNYQHSYTKCILQISLDTLIEDL